MFRNIIFTFLFISVSNTVISQEVFTDTHNNKQNIFLGAYSENLDSLKILENGVVKWKNINNLEQIDICSTKEFYEKISQQGLSFTLEGYEPFWEIKIEKNNLIYLDDDGENKECKIEIFIDEQQMNQRFTIMFKSHDHNIFGLISYLGFQPFEQGICECNISEEISLYEAYVCINKKIHRGCAKIENNDKQQR